MLENTISNKDFYKNHFDMTKIFARHPKLFSNLNKTSTCYIEMDIHYENIVNYFVKNIES